MLTSKEIRQSFLDFFASKSHSIVPSSSLMPDSPNLLFTNAGMNQFVPIFLGKTVCPYPTKRASDTQKCIRAGGKHNDLDDVGLDTYHHTFFEMLGNWSFGDYFKKEAICWAWELITEVWKFPKARLYATVYCPDKSKGAPSEFDQEAYDCWAKLFTKAGLDPKVHIINGGKKDNFWMMGDTGPCGPCSELHIDLTPEGNTEGKLVNAGVGDCIEIWNLVFMQFNANPDGTFSPLPSKNVDTGMGFERAVSIIQCTKNFTDFSGVISNYETDVFRPIFSALEKMSDRKYSSTLPNSKHQGVPEQMRTDIAFRVIADHIRTLTFAIADGIIPGNNDRNYVMRRILRRAVRYGRHIGFTKPFFYQLVDVVADTMGDVFPEVRERQQFIKETIKSEEEAFNRTLDRGITMFEEEVHKIKKAKEATSAAEKEMIATAHGLSKLHKEMEKLKTQGTKVLSGDFAFLLYDTYGFPYDLTELMAREVGMQVDKAAFDKLMEEQRKRARAAQKKVIVEVDTGLDVETFFVGYDSDSTACNLVGLFRKGGLDPNSPTVVVSSSGKIPDVIAKMTFLAAVDISCCYAEMGGQVGDTGLLTIQGIDLPIHIIDTVKRGTTFFLKLSPRDCAILGWHRNMPENFQAPARISLDSARRRAIERNHTATHLLHWALHKVCGQGVVQKGSSVTPDKFTFDFNSAALTPDQLATIEALVNAKILENHPVTWSEVDFEKIKSNAGIMQLFGEKYGSRVRVVQVGGTPSARDGFSMELCGGTHVRSTGEIGQFRILAESAVSSGVRRIEAITGEAALSKAKADTSLIRQLAGIAGAQIIELQPKLTALVEHAKDLEKQIKSMLQKQAILVATEIIGKAETIGNIPTVILNLKDTDSDMLLNIIENMRSRFTGVIVLANSVDGQNVMLTAAVSKDFVKVIQAGKIIQTIAPIVNGRGGGKPDFARGGGKDASKLDEALNKVKELVSNIA